jgi:S1-C subfamily serine protease
MSATANPTPIEVLSASLRSLVTNAAPSLVAVRSHHSLSTGFMWKPGLIVTADEALADEGEIAVTLADAKSLSASVVGRDPSTDLALLRVAASDCKPVDLEDCVPGTGSLVVAVGSREGDPVAALGIVATSGPAWRSLRGGDIDARIELDLTVRGCAEGGLALDAAGRPFGMIVFGPRRRVLAIPARTIARVANQLETHGRVARGYLGLALQGVRLDRDGGAGAMVMSVDADGPGAKAGIRQGDVIQAWGGQPIRSLQQVLRSLGPASVGTTVSLVLSSAGETRALNLLIGERPPR